MKQHVGRMRPVGQPQQDIVSPREEEQNWHITKCQNTGAPHEIGHELLVPVYVPLVWFIRPQRLVADCKEDNVQDDHHRNVKALTDGRDVTE